MKIKKVVISLALACPSNSRGDNSSSSKVNSNSSSSSSSSRKGALTSTVYGVLLVGCAHGTRTGLEPGGVSSNRGRQGSGGDTL